MILLHFLVYINNLADGLSSNANFFADDTSLFLVIHDVDNSVKRLNNNFYQINEWVFLWKIAFNTDASKHVREVIFSRKTKKVSHPSLHFNNRIASQTPYQKYRNIFLKT